MEFSVATNMENSLIEGLSGFPVCEIFGKLSEDMVGGGRAPYQLPHTSTKQFVNHVSLARRKGMGFNYLLNASCMGNRDITRRGQREIRKLLDWISEIGVTTVTIASPYLLRVIKTCYPGLSVRVSVFAGIDRVRKAQMWEELGADSIVLDSLLVNRELSTLKEIRKNVSCDLVLLLNNNCLSGCALSPMHMNTLSHAGQSWHENRGFFIDWCFLACSAIKMENPLNYIRSDWIRPEDLHIYRSMGFSRFKIAERGIPTVQMMKRVTAYTQGRFDGNLLELIQPFGFKETDRNGRYYRKGLRWILRYVFRPFLVNPARMLLLKRLADFRYMTRPLEGNEPVYMDNRKLDGFIERFIEKGCRDVDCEECRWCHDFTDKSVRIDEAHRKEALALYDRIFRELEEGSFWSYRPSWF